LASCAASFGSGRRRSWFGESEFRSRIFRPIRNAELRSARVSRPRRNRRQVSLIRLVSALLQATARLIKENEHEPHRTVDLGGPLLTVTLVIAGASPQSVSQCLPSLYGDALMPPNGCSVLIRCKRSTGTRSREGNTTEFSSTLNRALALNPLPNRNLHLTPSLMHEPVVRQG
jgi:hypothetical protein